MNYTDAISYLYALQKYGIKFGLDNTIRLLSYFGKPHNNFKAIHVAGTNGKGSTSAMIASMLHAHGFKVGLFTSPHLVSFTERIRINNREIKESEVLALTEEIRSAIEKINHGFSPTFFEFVTVMAFLYFSRRNVDWAVIETGMGGRLDATNVITPLVSVITKIDLDHEDFLGRTLKAIALEKAGIIKEGVPLVTASQSAEVLEVLLNRATEMDSKVNVYGRDFHSQLKRIDVNGLIFDYSGKENFKNLFIPLTGKHQLENASLAIMAVEMALGIDGSIGLSVNRSAVRRGLANTRWPGRLELIRNDDKNYDFLIDGAHNPSAARILAEALRTYYKPHYGRVIFIIGVMADKDIPGILIPLLSQSNHTIFTAPNYKRSATPDLLFSIAKKEGFNGEVCLSLRDSLKRAEDIALGSEPVELSERTLIVITGSFYTIGEALEELGRKGVLQSLREVISESDNK